MKQPRFAAVLIVTIFLSFLYLIVNIAVSNKIRHSDLAQAETISFFQKPSNESATQVSNESFRSLKGGRGGGGSRSSSRSSGRSSSSRSGGTVIKPVVKSSSKSTGTYTKVQSYTNGKSSYTTSANTHYGTVKPTTSYTYRTTTTTYLSRTYSSGGFYYGGYHYYSPVIFIHDYSYYYQGYFYLYHPVYHYQPLGWYWILITLFIVLAVLLLVVSISMSCSNDQEDARRYQYEPQDVEIVERQVVRTTYVVQKADGPRESERFKSEVLSRLHSYDQNYNQPFISTNTLQSQNPYDYTYGEKRQQNNTYGNTYGQEYQYGPQQNYGEQSYGENQNLATNGHQQKQL